MGRFQQISKYFKRLDVMVINYKITMSCISNFNREIILADGIKCLSFPKHYPSFETSALIHGITDVTVKKTTKLFK